jgi:hypothetical protein
LVAALKGPSSGTAADILGYIVYCAAKTEESIAKIAFPGN